jgi:thymidylate synthase
MAFNGNNKENAEHQYLNILQDILNNGIQKNDRTGTGTKSLFGKSITHNYENGVPLLTTKKMFIRGIVGELLWFLQGTEDAQFLIDNNIHIWDGWMKQDENGKNMLPHTYGVKWRNFDGVDQISNIIKEINNNPYSRRMVISAWDPRHIMDAALTWCHILFQFYVELDEDLPPDRPPPEDGKKGFLSIAPFQRSADFFFFWGCLLICFHILVCSI